MVRVDVILLKDSSRSQPLMVNPCYIHMYIYNIMQRVCTSLFTVYLTNGVYIVELGVLFTTFSSLSLQPTSPGVRFIACTNVLQTSVMST